MTCPSDILLAALLAPLAAIAAGAATKFLIGRIRALSWIKQTGSHILALALGLIAFMGVIRGYAKHGNTNSIQMAGGVAPNATQSLEGDAPLRRTGDSPPCQIAAEDVSNGWRVAATREGRAPSRPQDGTCTIHEPWLVRGGFEDLTRISVDGWLFPWHDGFADGLTVFSDGKIRPALRTPYFPRPFDAPLAVVPAFNWHLLPGGVSNVFWHASTPSNSLIVAWENAPVNYDVSCLTNFHAEFFADGHFSYRYDDHVVDYVPVFTFDWDNDGLENSVDPDPLAAGPDAHGTNAEWYNVVCSNIVNSNAYYFVDMVAERGPAPIYFVGDRESRLGNPVVVALAGITNRVPLLIGVSYAITSTVPISVSIPENGFATITTNCVSNYALQWPLEFTVAPDGTGYSVSAGPYDPGCVFQWDLPTRSATCGYATDGGWIGFGCHGSWTCGCGGCSVSGVAMLEDVSFDLPYVWCGCWHHSPVNSGIGQYVTNRPSVSVSFDNPVVFYEDAYTNAPNDVVAKHSTNTTLAVFAYGGEAGGMLHISAQNIGKLVRVGGKAISFPYTAFVPPQSGVSLSIEYEAAEYSDSIDDISVTAVITSCDGDPPVSDSDTATSVKVRITACRQFPDFRRRHTYGICEDIWCEWFPKSAAITWAHSGEGHWAEIGPTYRRFVFPQEPCSPVLTVSYDDVAYDLDLTCVAPHSIDAKFDNYMVATPPTAGKSGLVGMLLQLTLMPTNVSFEGLYVEEIPTATGTHTGYFDVPAFSNWWYHTRANGAGDWYLTGMENRFAIDEAVMQEECLPPWSNGEITWQIPIEWAFSSTNTAGTGTLFYSDVQRFLIDTEGTVSIEKSKYIISRSTNDVFSLKKRMSQ